MKFLTKISLIFLFVSVFSFPAKSDAQLTAIRDIIYPIVGNSRYSNSFGDPRSDGRTHEGTDVFAKKMTPLVSAVDGTITLVNYPEASWGMSVTIKDADGYTYHYIHMNNDTPGTDDGKAEGIFAYAPDVVRGKKVVKGQLLGYVGDSGNAETTPPHLHFEIRLNGDPINAFESLNNATKIDHIVSDYPVDDEELIPYGNFAGGTNVAEGDVIGDSKHETVTGANFGGSPLLKVFDQNKNQIASFLAYDEKFNGGIDVSIADMDGDGKAEIITASGPGGGPHIRIFKSDGAEISAFYAYAENFHGGINVASADVDGDGKAEIITAPKAGGGPHVRVFDENGQIKNEFFAYDSAFRGGVNVSAVDSTSNDSGYVVTAPGIGGGPHIKVYDKSFSVPREFFAYDSNFTIGVKVAVNRLASDPTKTYLMTVPASSGGPHIKQFDLGGNLIKEMLDGFEPWWRGGYDVSFSNSGEILMSSQGNRRTTVRSIQTIQVNNGAGSEPWWKRLIN